MASHEDILSRLEGVRPSGQSGRQWTALCPAHEDGQHSLAIGLGEDDRVLLKCYAGCHVTAIVGALQYSMADLFPEEGPSDTSAAPVRMLTLSALAFDKRLPSAVLRDYGVDDSPDEGVRIAYYDAARRRVATKLRTALEARRGSRWPAGVPLYAYGVWRLPDAVAAGYVVLVEGESDCWTLWHYGKPALGIPGASAAKTLTGDLLQGIERVFVWQEPGGGGKEFVSGIARQLKVAGWTGDAKVITGGPVKDPNALHQRDPEGFETTWDVIIAAAKPMPKATAEKPKPQNQPKRIHIPDSVAAKAEETAKIPPPAPGFYGLTDWGNAQRLAFRHGKDVRYCHLWGKWLIWDGSRWKLDGSGEIFRRATDTITAIYSEANQAPTAELRQEISRHAQKSEAWPRIRAIVEKSRSENLLPVSPESLDADPWLFNCLNGTVDLRTGNLLHHERSNYLTKLAPVHYDADATCPHWEVFLQRIMAGNEELIRFLQLSIGYSLTGAVREKCFFFLYGTGDNGKSTLIEALADLMGDYWAKTTAETVLAKKYGAGVPNDVARLVGARLVSTAELPEGQHLDEAKVKDLTGRDTITARFMRAEWFEFRPVFKLWMYGNHKPVIRGADEGIWKRVRLIPFSVTIPKDQQDETLPDKLREEAAGILAWAVRGCVEWQRDGLPIPRAIREATEDYRSDMDIMAAFFGDCCLIAENARCLTAELYGAYKTWCDRQSVRPLSQPQFGATMKQRGFRPFKSGNFRGWYGISVLAPEAQRDKGTERDGRNGFFDSRSMQAHEELIKKPAPFVPLCPNGDEEEDCSSVSDRLKCFDS